MSNFAKLNDFSLENQVVQFFFTAALLIVRGVLHYVFYKCIFTRMQYSFDVHMTFLYNREALITFPIPQQL